MISELDLELDKASHEGDMGRRIRSVDAQAGR